MAVKKPLKDNEGPALECKSKDETVSSPCANKPVEISAQPTVDGGPDSGCGHWEGNGQDVKFVK